MSLSLEQGAFGLDDLRLLTALAAAGSLAGAARRLKLNHASAWRRLGALEGRLGVRLFERGRDGYAPTPAGEAAIATAQRMLGELTDLERRLAGQDVRPSGPVRLTTTETLLELVMPALAALRASHPGIVVDLVTDNAFFSLTRRDADIALRPAAAAPEGLVARRLGAVATAVYASPAWLSERSADDPAALDWLGQQFAALQAEALGAFQGISDALAAGDLALAARWSRASGQRGSEGSMFGKSAAISAICASFARAHCAKRR